MKRLFYFLFFLTAWVPEVLFAQPANDNCAGAIAFPSLDVPATCGGGGGGFNQGNTSTLAGTNIGATAEAPYPYIATCPISVYNPPRDVWYSFVATGYQTTVSIANTTGTLTNPFINVWTGTCTNLEGVGCASGPGASITIYQTVIGQTYYVQVSGSDSTETGMFDLSVACANNCNTCVLQSSIVPSVLPVNGTYNPGQTVTFCYTVSQYQQIAANWLHGVTVSFGSGWDASSLVIDSVPPSCTTGGGAYWEWEPNGETSSGTPPTYFGPGFYYETASGTTAPCGCVDNNPGNNFGDVDAGQGTCSPTFCITLTVNPTDTQGAQLNVSFATSGDGESGSWNTPGCGAGIDSGGTFYAVTSCGPPIMTHLPASCSELDGIDTATAVGPDSPYIFHWSTGVIDTENRVSIIRGLATGRYYLTVINSQGCITTATDTIPNTLIPDGGPTQYVSCPAVVDSVVMAGVGPGIWSQLTTNPAPTVIISPSSPNTTIKGFSALGTYKYVWAVSTCTDTVSVIVSSHPIVAADTVYTCVNGTATMAGVGTGTWAALPGNPSPTVIADSTAYNTTITGFTLPGTYAFIWYVNSCRDTTYVVIPDFVSSATASVSTLCKYQTANLSATAGPASLGPFFYTWVDAGDVVSPNSATTAIQPILNPTSYIVAVSSASGCVLFDTVPIALSGAAPRIQITPSTNEVCPGTPVILTPKILAENLVQCGITNTLPPLNYNTTGYIDNSFTSSDTNNTTAPGISGTETYCSPFMGAYSSFRAQYLIRASELNAAGLSSGVFTDFSFYIKTLNSSTSYDSFSVSMGCTNLDSLTDFVNNLQVVIPTEYGTNAPTANVNLFANQWNTQFLTNYFSWDGSSNIVIQICYTFNSNLGSADDYIAYNTTSYPSTVLAGDDLQENIEGCSLTLSNNDLGNTAGVTTVNTRPDFLFHMTVPNVLNYHWSPSGSCATCSVDTAIVTTNTTYTLTVTDNVCSNVDSVNLLINPYIPLIGTPVDTAICNSGFDTIQLNVALANAPDSQCIKGYTVSSIPYSTISGNITSIPAADYTDQNGNTFATENGTAGPYGMGFTFPFYCDTFSQFYVNTNGWVTFQYPYPFANAADEYTAQTLPSSVGEPFKTIELMMGEYNLAGGGTGGGGTIDYFVSGSAPSRVLVVQFNNMKSATGGHHTSGEIHLYETSGIIDIMLTSSTYSGTNHTTGITDDVNLGIAAPGRNNQMYTITTAEGWRFAPIRGAQVSILGSAWSPTTFLNSGTISNPIAVIDTSETYVIRDSLIINRYTADSSYCIVYDTIHIRHGVFTATATATPPTICPGATSQLSVASADSVASYLWTPLFGLSSDSVYDPSASVLDTTTYYVSLRSNIGCVIHDTVTVYVSATPHPYLGNDTTVCYPDSVLLSFPGSYVSYQWYLIDTTTGVRTPVSSGPTATSYDAPSPGSYVLELTSTGISCPYFTNILSIDTFARQVIVVDTSGPTGFCAGGNVVLQVTQGLNNIQWTPPSYGSQTSFPVTTSGVFYYSATDQNNCVLHSDTVTVTATPKPTFVIDPYRNPICSANSDTITAGSNPPGATITWTYNGTQTSGNTIITTDTGTYYIAADLNGCTNTDSIFLTAAQSPIVTLPTYSVCNCRPDTSVAPTIIGGTPGYTYIWSNGSTDSVTVDTTLNASQYNVTVTDANGCTAVSNVGTITMSCPRVDITIVPASDSIFIRDTAYLVAVAPGGSSYSYVWSCDSGTVLSPDSSFTGVIARRGALDTVGLLVTDPVTTCTAYYTQVLTVIDSGAFRMPSAFTPNGDGMNDNFYIVVNGPVSPIKVVSFNIYDRWGQLVYSDPNAPGWDGTFGGNPQPTGAYVYFITVQYPDPTNASREIESSVSGTFMLFR